MGLIVDNFAGGGGASYALEQALGRPVDIAVNHDPDAIAMHTANHPDTRHFLEDVFHVDPAKACQGQPIDVAWFSPDCKHFSRAKGGKPVSKRVRGLAWVVLRWASLPKWQRPRVIFLENVEEFETWGPVCRRGRPIAKGMGQTFRLWVSHLEALGYTVEWRSLRACDFGAPTIRKRLFLVARCDGEPIVWPEPTHADPKLKTKLEPWRTAADIIDWSLPCPSIFERKRPLKPNTLRRIARGLQRYLIEAADPFIVPVTQSNGGNGPRSVDQPHATITTAKGGDHALVVPTVARFFGTSNCDDIARPLGTVMPDGGGKSALIAPTLIQTGYGERTGQAPRALNLGAPLGTVVAGGAKHALVAAFMAQHNTGVTGHAAQKPVSTLTARATHQNLVTSHLVSVAHGDSGGRRSYPVDEPVGTITGGGNHLAEVRAFLLKYYGADQDPRLDEPLHTVTTKDRFGLVTVAGQDYQIVDIGMRMLAPHELYAAQGFPADYIIRPEINGKPMTKTASVARCGNSVSPPPAIALITANAPMFSRLEVAA